MVTELSSRARSLTGKPPEIKGRDHSKDPNYPRWKPMPTTPHSGMWVVETAAGLPVRSCRTRNQSRSAAWSFARVSRLHSGARIASASSRVHNPAPGHDPEGGRHKHREPSRAADRVCRRDGAGASWRSRVISRRVAIVDLGTPAQCDAQEIVCLDDSWEPRDQMGIVANNGQLSGRPFWERPSACRVFLGGATNRHVLDPLICAAIEQSPGAFCDPSPSAVLTALRHSSSPRPRVKAGLGRDR